MPANRTLPRRVVKVLQFLNISLQTVTMLGSYQLGGFQNFGATDNGTAVAVRSGTRLRSKLGAASTAAPANGSAGTSVPERANRRPPVDSPVLRWQRREAVANSQLNLIIATGMLCVVLIIVVVVFYFSHRSFRKRGNSVYHLQRSWLEPDSVLDVYTVDSFSDQPPPSPGNHRSGPPANANDLSTGDATAAELAAHRRHYLRRFQPPPSYESLVIANAVPVICTRQACIQQPQQQQLARGLFRPIPLCSGSAAHAACQRHREQRVRLIERQDYDTISQCRQCRKQIRCAEEDNGEDDRDAAMGGDGDDNSRDVGVKYCKCLLSAATASAGAIPHRNGVDKDEDKREQQLVARAKLGKPISVTDTALMASSTRALRAPMRRSVDDVGAGGAQQRRETAAAPSANSVVAAKLQTTQDVEDEEDEEEDDGDLHTRLVKSVVADADDDGERLVQTEAMDNSGLPSYDAAAKLRRPIGGGLD